MTTITCGTVRYSTPEYRVKSRARAKAWRLANPERAKASFAAWRAANKERIREDKKAWYEKNRDSILADQRREYAASPSLKTRKKRQAAQWVKDNSRVVYARNKARKIKKRESLKASLAQLQRGRCAYCREILVAGKIHIDHIMPFALGGSNNRSNLQLTCDVCNFSKNRRHPIAFAQSLGRLL